MEKLLEASVCLSVTCQTDLRFLRSTLPTCRAIIFNDTKPRAYFYRLAWWMLMFECGGKAAPRAAISDQSMGSRTVLFMAMDRRKKRTGKLRCECR